MRDKFAPVIEGFDCDGITNPWSFQCEPFYEDGGNGGTMIDGTTVRDILAAKSRLSWTLNVLTPEQYAELNTMLNAGETIGTVTAYVYDTIYNAVRLAQFHVTPPACHTIDNFGQLYVIPQSALILEEAASIARFAVTPPTKTTYYVEEALDLAGVSVTRYDRDGTPADITTECAFDPAPGSVMQTAGAVTLTINHNNAPIAYCPLTVTVAPDLVSVAITSYPNRMRFAVGDTLDYAGLVVTATYADSTTRNVTPECTVSPAVGTSVTQAGTIAVTVSYNGANAGTFNVMAATAVTSGDWWTLFLNGLLYIYCDGDMPDYTHPVYSGKAPWYDYRAQITDVTIHNSVTSIGNYTFYNFTSITSVIIPDSVTSIGKYAFGFSSITSVTIPNSVTSIGSEAFIGCLRLTSITIPDSVTSIGNDAFRGTSLISVIIPDGVTSIERDVFARCSSLTSVTIPNSVTSIGSEAFYGCSRLTSITIPNSVTSIGNSAFYSTHLTSVTINRNATVGRDAFPSGCVISYY